VIELAWDRIGADLGQVCDLVVDVEEAHHPAGRWGVQDDGVVRGCDAGPLCPVVLAPPNRLIDLAGEQDVAHAGRDCGGEVDGAEPLQHPARATELVVHLEVFQQGGLGIHREPEDLSAVGSVSDADLRRGQRGDVEGLADALASLDLGQQHPPALPGQGQGQGGCHGCLAGAALAGDDVQSHAVPVGVAR